MTEKQQRYEDQLIKVITENFSPFSTYQIIMVSLLSLVWIQICFMGMIGSFVFMNPLFTCQGEEYSEEIACQQISTCDMVNSYTGTYHGNLYCDKQSDRELIQSAYFFGNIFGMLVIPILSDYKGRRISMIGCLFTGVISCLFITIGIYANSFFLMFIGQVINGFVGSGIVVIGYVYVSEICSRSHRQLGIMALMISWSFGYALFFLIYYLLPEWYNFMIFLIIIPLTALTLLFDILMLETPTYNLFIRKNRVQFQKTLLTLAAFNRPDAETLEKSIESGINILEDYQSSMHNAQKATLKTVFIEMFKVKENLESVFFITLLYTAYNIEYFGGQMCFERIGLNYGTTLLSVGISELVVNSTLSYFVHKIPRKKALFLTITIGSILGLLFAFPAVQKNLIAQVVIVILYRGCSIAFSTFVIFCQTQTFSQTIRSTAIGLTSSIGKLINTFVPFIVTWLNDRNIHPLVGLTVFFLGFSIPSSIFIKQTLHKHEVSFNTAEKSAIKESYEETPLQ